MIFLDFHVCAKRRADPAGQSGKLLDVPHKQTCSQEDSHKDKVCTKQSTHKQPKSPNLIINPSRVAVSLKWMKVCFETADLWQIKRTLGRCPGSTPPAAVPVESIIIDYHQSEYENKLFATPNDTAATLDALQTTWGRSAAKPINQFQGVAIAQWSSKLK